MPCSLVSLDIQDIMGSHIVNVESDLYKYKLNSDGKKMGKEVINVHHKDEVDEYDLSRYEEIKEEIKNRQGCLIYGQINVKKVPGNFHISSHAFGKIVGRLAQEGFYNWDVSHKINHFSIGDFNDNDDISKKFIETTMRPLDGIEKMDNEKKVYEYFLKVKKTLI
jgi:hypothetical protein